MNNEKTKKERLIENLKQADENELKSWLTIENDYVKNKNASAEVIKNDFINFIINEVKENEIFEGNDNGYIDDIYHKNPVEDFIFRKMFIPNFKD